VTGGDDNELWSKWLASHFYGREVEETKYPGGRGGTKRCWLEREQQIGQQF
jgi:hypothetical protein